MADMSKFQSSSGVVYDIKDTTARTLMTGATSSTAGVQGQVPAPAAGDGVKFLRGDGTWQTASAASGAATRTVTLTSSGWTNGSQTVTVTGITSESDGIISVSSTATSAQRDAARDANLVITAQSTNSMTITADGIIPTVDVPIDVMFWSETIGIGGHTIVDENDVAYAQRNNLKIINATITDDLTNDTTIVEITGGGGTTIIQKPTVTVGTYTYNGNAQGPTIEGLDTANTVVTNATKTAAGTYTLTIALANTSTMVWNDLTNADLTYEYTIDKATQTISASASSVTLDNNTLTSTVTINGVQGTLSATSNNTSIATTSISGSTITISNVNQTSGSTTVSVSAASTTNYNASNTLTITVTASFIPLKSWASATDDEIDQMLTAAQAGTIDLYNDAGWRVGDERTVSLSAMSATGVGETHVAQTVTMVLVNKGGKYTSNGTECSFIIQPKNMLANGTTREGGYMNSTNTNEGGWTSCARRTWCNNVYKAALPSYLRSHLLQVANKTSAGSQSTTINTDYDYCALPSCIEVGQRTTTSPYSNEGTQWSYYSDNASRIKYAGDSGSASGWWLRSPHASSGTDFCFVYYDGSGGNTGGGGAYGLVPFCCI